MKIERIELFHVSIPLENPFYPTRIPEYRDALLTEPILAEAGGTLARRDYSPRCDWRGRGRKKNYNRG